MYVKCAEYQLCACKTDEVKNKFMFYICFYKQKTIKNLGFTYILFRIVNRACKPFMLSGKYYLNTSKFYRFAILKPTLKNHK